MRRGPALRFLWVNTAGNLTAAGSAALDKALGQIGLHQGLPAECGIVLSRIAPQSPKEVAVIALFANINQAGRVTSALSPANRSACARSQASPHSDRSYSPTANATTESPCLLPSLPWPPAQITTYCLPPALNVIGVACALAGSSAFQTSVPVSTSNARR